MQRRGMKQKNRWAYMLCFLGTGALYLSCVDRWRVYEEPLKQVRSWCEEFGADGFLAAGAGGVHGTDELLGSEGGFLADGVAGGGMDGCGTEGVPGDGFWSNGAPEGGSDGSLGEAAPGGGSDGSRVDGAEGSAQDSTETAAAGDGRTDGTDYGNSGEGEPGGAFEGGADAAEPEYMTVEDDYFSDAVFIGDSRTVGMFEYGGLEEISTFYASKGLTVYKMFDSEIVSVPGQKKKITVEEALQQNTFAKIYLMIGINEMGTGTVETFMEKYREAVAHLQELQPDAVICLQGIIKVTAERSAQGDYITNEGIVARNDAIAELADNEKIFYLDVNPLICDETEGMNASYTFDGVHLKAQYIGIWKDYLKTHAISP